MEHCGAAGAGHLPAPQSKGSCYRHLCTLCNGRQAIYLLKACSFQRLHGVVQDMPFRSCQSQEPLSSERFLGQILQILDFGGLRNREVLALIARQTYAELKHLQQRGRWGRIKPTYSSKIPEPKLHTFFLPLHAVSTLRCRYAVFIIQMIYRFYRAHFLKDPKGLSRHVFENNP